jgi:hypothetical protein
VEKEMERAIPIDLQQIERKLLAAFERYGSDGRAITLQSLATSVGTHGNAKEFRLALKDLVGRGLVRRAGEDPIPGSAIAFRLVAPVMRGGVGKTEDQSNLSRARSVSVEQSKPPRRHRSSMPAC